MTATTAGIEIRKYRRYYRRMDEFRAWVGEIGQRAAAELLECSPSLISHWLCGRKAMTEDWAPVIERVSNGRVRCESLFPGIQWERERGVVVGYRVPVAKVAA